MHAGNAGQAIVAAQHCEHSRERPERGSGVAEVKLRAPHGQPTRCARDTHAIRAFRAALHAQRTQRFEHEARVVGIENIAHPCFAFSERRQQEHAIGNALRARQAHRAMHRRDGREIEVRHVRFSRSLSSQRSARGARALEHVRERVRVTAQDRGARDLELIRVVVEQIDQRFAVRDTDVAPHFRRAARDAHRVAQAAAGEAQQRGRVPALRQHAHEREGDDVRQVTYGREDFVVRSCVQTHDARAARFPCSAHRANRGAPRLRLLHEDHVAVAIELRESGSRTALLGAGDRVRRNETLEVIAQKPLRIGDHVLLGAAAVGDHRGRRQDGRDLRHHFGHLSHRRAEEHEVGVADGFDNIVGSLVDHTQTFRLREVLARASDA